MDKKQLTDFKRLYFAVCDFVGCYEAFLETRDIDTNKRCNTSYMWLRDALHNVSID